MKRATELPHERLLRVYGSQPVNVIQERRVRKRLYSERSGTVIVTRRKR
jgi:hypothetical protein